MSLIKRFLPIVVITANQLFLSNTVDAQNVGVNFNGSAPNASAAFDIDVSAMAGTKKGMLIPRVTQSERNAMNPLLAAAPGLIVYQTDAAVGFYYNSSASTNPIWTQVMSTQSLRWDMLQNATSDLTLNNGNKTTTMLFPGFTTGNAFTIACQTLAQGSLFNLLTNSNDGTSNINSSVLNVNHIGANVNSNHISIGVASSVTNTGANSTNYAGYFKATGANFNFAIMVPDGGGKVSIGSPLTSANALLTIKNGHFQSQQSVAPTIATNINAGVLSDGIVEAGSSDIAGTFTINTTNTSLAAGAQATITFNETFGTKPRVILTAASLNATSRAYYVTATSSGFTIYFTVAPLAGTSYGYNYMVIEN